ncbi:MAG: hypothetical protein G01um101472_299 [Parcubacteria group bacterium Gr01-1014_72]|nr:MAG: hypothetical protein G01um101472_299 [Parcubacteria group bacterium Gr01-1014_72]
MNKEVQYFWLPAFHIFRHANATGFTDRFSSMPRANCLEGREDGEEVAQVRSAPLHPAHDAEEGKPSGEHDGVRASDRNRVVGLFVAV